MNKNEYKIEEKKYDEFYFKLKLCLYTYYNFNIIIDLIIYNKYYFIIQQELNQNLNVNRQTAYNLITSLAMPAFDKKTEMVIF